MKEIFFAVGFFLCVFIAGLTVGGAIEESRRNKELRAVGIEEIRHCKVYTTEVSSNWYEIVWMDKERQK